MQVHAGGIFVFYFRSALFIILPGRRLFRRNEVERVAKKRLVSLAEYCSDLMKLDEQISKSGLVVEFFTATESDINPPNKDRLFPFFSQIIIKYIC